MSVTLTGSCTANEAPARLVAGNERFVRGEARFPMVQKEILAELARSVTKGAELSMAPSLAVKLHHHPMPTHVAVLMENILRGLRDVPSGMAPDHQLRAAVEANVRWSVHQILATPEATARVAEGVVKVVGAVYELDSGGVRFLS